MGMFDWVTPLPKTLSTCPYCGGLIEAWQTKQGPGLLESIPYERVHNFYSSCDHCHEWVEYTRQHGEETFTLRPKTVRPVKERRVR